MGPSKAQAGASEEHKTMYFVWFPAHRLFLSWKRLNLGQDASRWPKMRHLEAHLGLKRPPLETPKMVWGGETNRHHGHFRIVFFSIKTRFMLI